MFRKIQKFTKFTLNEVRKKKRERPKMITQVQSDNELSRVSEQKHQVGGLGRRQRPGKF